MRFSLIVTANRREKELRRFFESVVNNNYKDLEIIFIDQCDTELNEKIINDYKEKVNIVYIAVKKRLSLSAARNIGLKKANGEIIGFPDDDCWYSENFFSELENIFKKRNMDFVCCSVYDPIINENYGNKYSNKKEVRINNKNSFRYTTSVGIFLNRNNCGVIPFDEELGVGAKWFGGEDLDYVLSLLYRRKIGMFLNDLKVYHECESSCIDYEKIYKYNIGFGAILKKAAFIYKNKYARLIYLEKIFKIKVKKYYYKIVGNEKNSKEMNSILNGLSFGYNNYK